MSLFPTSGISMNKQAAPHYCLERAYYFYQRFSTSFDWSVDFGEQSRGYPISSFCCSKKLIRITCISLKRCKHYTATYASHGLRKNGGQFVIVRRTSPRCFDSDIPVHNYAGRSCGFDPAWFQRMPSRLLFTSHTPTCPTCTTCKHGLQNM